MARYYDRNRAVDKARRQVEALLEAALLEMFRQLWLALWPKVRDQRYGEIDAIIFEWEQRLDEDYDNALALGADTISAVEVAWWAALGRDLPLTGAEVLRAFDDQTVAEFGRRPALMIGENIRAGMARDLQAAASAGLKVEDVQRRLKVWIDQARAQTIAITDTTDLISLATELAMRQAGAGFWIWQALEIAPGILDPNVCEECESLHGRIFAVGDDYPPKHRRCRCVAVPLHDRIKPKR